MTSFPFFQQPQPTYAPQPYAPPPSVPQQPAYAPQAFAPQPSSPGGWQPLAAQAAQINQPKARAYAPDSPPPAPTPAPAAPMKIQLPTPEELGLKSPASPPIAARPVAAVPVTRAPTPTLPAAAQDTVDWNQTHARLRELGAVGFQLDQLPGGATRVRMMMPTNQPGTSRLVEAIASSDVEAIATMFERATR